jgi:hypothetical protein
VQIRPRLDAQPLARGREADHGTAVAGVLAVPLAADGAAEVGWDVDRYNLPHGEEVAAVLIYVQGKEQPIDAGIP